MSEVVPKGLNTKGGKNRYKFLEFSSRVKSSDKNVARRVRAEHERAAAPEAGEQACFFQEELARLKELDVSLHFSRFSRVVKPLSQSLALLLHHKDEVADALLTALPQHEGGSWKSLLSLLGVFVRDLREEAYPHFPRMCAVLKGMISAATPELTAEVFRTLSFVFKYLAPAIVADPEYSTHFNVWTPLLASRRHYFRDMTAAALALLLRKQSASGLQMQLTALLRGVSRVPSALPSGEEAMSATQAAATGVLSSSVELVDGVATLIFECMRGVAGGFHSLTPTLLPALLAAFEPKRAKVHAMFDAPAQGDAQASATLYHAQLAARFQVAAQVARAMCSYTNRTHAPVVLNALLTAMSDATKAWSKAEADLTPPPPPAASGRRGSAPSAANTAAAARARDATQAYLNALSLYIGQLASLLVQWFEYRAAIQVPISMAPALLEALRRLFAPRLWTSPHLASVSRHFMLRLLLASWSHLCSPVVDAEPSKAGGRAAGAARGRAAGAMQVDDAEEAATSEEEASDEEDDASVGDMEEEEEEEEGEEGAATAATAAGAEEEDAGAVAQVQSSSALTRDTQQKLLSRLLACVFAVTQDTRAFNADAATVGIMLAACPQPPTSTSDKGVAVAHAQRGARVMWQPGLACFQMVLAAARALLLLSVAFTGVSAGTSLAVLLPHLRDFLKPLAASPATAPAVWSVLLAIRDALAAHREAVADAFMGVSGMVTATGRIAMDSDDALAALALAASRAATSAADGAALSGANPASFLADVPFSMAACLVRDLFKCLRPLRECVASGERALRDKLTPDAFAQAYNSLSCVATIVAPAHAIAPALQAVVRTIDAALERADAPSASASAPSAHLPARCILQLHHLRAIALTQLVEVTTDTACMSAAAMANDTAAERKAMDAVLDRARTALLSPDAVSAHTHWACSVAHQVRDVAGRVSWRASAAADALPRRGEGVAASTSAAGEDAGTPQQVEAAALASLRALGDYLTHVASQEAPDSLTPALRDHVLLRARHLAGHPDHALRLALLRVVVLFPSPEYLGAAVTVPTHVTCGGVSTQVLLDAGVRAAPEAQTEECVTILEQCLRAEALPVTFAYERVKTSILARMMPLLQSHQLPPLVLSTLLHYVLGVFYIKFAPLWPAATSVLTVAANEYPRTLWSILGRHVFAACSQHTYAPADAPADAADAGNEDAAEAVAEVEDGAPATRGGKEVDAVTRSQARADAAAARLSPLRAAARALQVVADADAAEAAAQEAAASAKGSTLALLAERAHAAEVHGLVGFFTSLPRVVHDIIASVEAHASRRGDAHSRASGVRFLHENDYVPLALGAAGATDADTMHASLMGALTAAPRFAEARSRTLVPIFLAFMRDDFYTQSHADDVDVVELRLPQAIARLYERAKVSAARAQVRAAEKAGAAAAAAAAAATTDAHSSASSSSSSSSATLADTDALLQCLVTGGAGASSVALPRSSVVRRLLSFLTLFETFRGWDGMFGAAVFFDVLTHLLAKADGGIADAALKVLVAMRLPYLQPYKEHLSRLLNDESYKTTMSLFTLSPSASVIAPEHRPQLLPLVQYLMFGRTLQRKGRSAKDTPAVRRTAILSYVSAATVPEAHVMWYQYMRPLLLGYQNTGLLPPLDGASERAASPDSLLAPVRAPRTPADATRLVAAHLSTLTTCVTSPDVVARLDAGVVHQLQYTTPARALGFLNAVRDLVKQYAGKLEPVLHHVLAGVMALLHASHRADAGADADMQSEEEGVEGVALPSVDAAFQTKDIRSLALLRLADVMRAFPTYNFAPWLPQLRRDLSAAIHALPGAMASAARASALLLLFVTLSETPELRPWLASHHAIIPAVLACLSAGLPASAATFDSHVANMAPCSTQVHLPAIDAAYASAEAEGRHIGLGPNGTVLAHVFQFVENLFSIQFDERTSFTRMAKEAYTTPLDDSLNAHIPFLLHHFAIRLAAAQRDSVALARAASGRRSAPVGASSSAPSALSAGDALPHTADCVVVPVLRLGQHAFARRQLLVLERLSEYVQVGASAVEAGSGQPRSVYRTSCQQLVVLLLPYLRSPDRRRGVAADDAATDPRYLVLNILKRLLPWATHVAAILPFLSTLLAPGIRAFKGVLRNSLLECIVSLAEHEELRHLAGAMRMLRQLGATNTRYVSEPDWDGIVAAAADLAARAHHAPFLRTLHARGNSASRGDAWAAALPAVLHQLVFLMHEVDMAARTGAANALLSFITTCADAANAVVAHLRDTPAAAQAVRLGAGGVLRLPATVDDSAPAFLVALHAIIQVLVPDIYTSLGTVSPAVRRGIVTLLADVVMGFANFGAAPARGDEEAAPAAGGVSTRVVTHPHLHSDLVVLRNVKDVEADIFMNLTHVQIHRRARSFIKLAAVVDSGALSLHSLNAFVMPLTLHSLYDEAHEGEVVESKGKTAKLMTGSTSAFVGGLHSEAVKLIASVSRRLPWSAYLNNLRSLLRQAKFNPQLEKVLLRAVQAMVDVFPFALSAPRDELAVAEFQVTDADFTRQLLTSIDTSGASGRRARDTLLALRRDAPVVPQDEAAGDENDATATSAPAAAAKKRGSAAGRAAGEEDDAVAEALAEAAAVDEDEEVESEAEAEAEVEGGEDEGDEGGDEEEVEPEAEAQVPVLLTTSAALEDGDAPHDGVSAELARRDMLLSLTTMVLPVLRALLFKPRKDNAGEKGAKGEMRPVAVMAYVRLVQFMPPRVFNGTVPRVVADVCSGLRSRAQDDRDQARNTLAKLASVLGAVSLSMLLSELRSSLIEGYQIHVTGHALYAIMDALAPSLTPTPPALPTTAAALPGAVEGEADVPDVDMLTDGAEAPPAPNPNSAHLTAAIPLVMQLVLQDVLGEAAEARAAESGYKPKTQVREARSCKSWDTMELLARCIPFLPDAAIHSVTAPLVTALEDALVRGNNAEPLEKLFRRVMAGLAANPSVTGAYLLLYAHGICAEFLHITPEVAAAALLPQSPKVTAPVSVFDKWLKPKRAAKWKPLTPWLVNDTAAVRASAGKGGANAAPALPEGMLLTGAMRLKGSGAVRMKAKQHKVLPAPKMTGSGRYVSQSKRSANSGAVAAADAAMGNFALSLLLSGFNKGRITSTDPALLDMLNPYVPLFLQLLQASHDNRIVVLALRCMAIMLPYPLPALRTLAPKLARTVLTQLHTSAGSGSAGSADTGAGSGHSGRSEMAVACLKVVTALCRVAWDAIRLSDEQQRALLLLIRADLHVQARQNSTYGLLKALVARKVMSAELYDLMDDVAKQIVQSLRPTARALCASVFLQFLLRYPMTDKRLQEYLDFFVANLTYEEESGRLAVLDILHAIVVKFPQAALDDIAAYLMLPLLVRLASEPSATCRAAVGTLLKQLFTHVSVGKAQRLAALMPRWMAPAEKPVLRRAAYQLLGLVADAQPSALQHVLPELLPMLVQEMVTAARAYRRAELVHSVAVTAAATAPSALVYGAEQGEHEEADAQVRADVRSAGIARGDADATPGAREDEQEAEADSAPPAPRFPEGTAGGSAGAVEEAALMPTSRAPTTSTPSNSARSGAECHVPWECAYQALVACTKLLGSNFARTVALCDEDGKAVASAPDAKKATKRARTHEASSEDTANARLFAPEEDGSWKPLFPAATNANIIAASVELLLFPHVWVRMAASRALSAVLTAYDAAPWSSVSGPQPSWLANVARLAALARRVVAQLSSEHLGATMTELCGANLLRLALAVYQLTPVSLRVTPHASIVAGHDADVAAAGGMVVEEEEETEAETGVKEDAAAVGASEDEADAAASDEDGEEADAGAGAGADADADEDEDGEEKLGGASSVDLLATLVPYACRMASMHGDAAKTAVLKFIAALMVKLPADDMRRYAFPAIQLLLRITSSNETPAQLGPAVRALAQEACDLMAHAIGAHAFTMAMAAERTRVSSLRLSRRSQRALTKVVDPEAAERMKEKRYAAKAKAKARKIDEMRRLRGKPTGGNRRGSSGGGSSSGGGFAGHKRPRA